MSAYRVISLKLVVVVALTVFAGPVGGETGRATPPPLPDTPVGRQLSWVLGTLEVGAPPLTPADLADHFAPAFLASLAPDEAVAATASFAEAYGPFVLDGFARVPTATNAVALITGNQGSRFVVILTVEATAPNGISRMELQPAPVGLGVHSAGDTQGLFDVEGRRLYLVCSGGTDGGPTVVLEAGHGNDSTVWLALQSALPAEIRVCSYDRANAPGGASDPASLPRSAGDVVRDLHALLDAADVPGPYVFVGHSLGGHFVRLYASTYPDEVAGLVLVDPSHEDQAARIKSLVGQELWDVVEGQISGLPDPEGFDLDAIGAEIADARADATLPLVDLVVLTHGNAPAAAEMPTGWPIEAELRLWHELHSDLAGLVPGGKLIVAEESGHFIQIDQPDLIGDVIADVVGAGAEPQVPTALGAARSAR